jgi:hypothetical protein
VHSAVRGAGKKPGNGGGVKKFDWFCGRWSKTGFFAGATRDELLREMAENRRPELRLVNVRGPRASVGGEKHGDGLAGSGRDFISVTLLDPALGSGAWEPRCVALGSDPPSPAKFSMLRRFCFPPPAMVPGAIALRYLGLALSGRVQN